MVIFEALGGNVRLMLFVAAAAATVFVSTEGISAPSSAGVAQSSNASNGAGEGAETEQAGVESETEAAAPASPPKDEESKKSDQALAAQVKLGDVYMQVGEWDLAIMAYAKVAESGKEPIASEARKGLAKAKVEQRKESDHALTAQVKLGDVYMQAGEWDSAVEAYAKAAESGKEPVASEARRGLANAKDKAKKESDQSVAALLELGDVYMQAGEWDTAVKVYVKAAETGEEPIASEARRDLAKALEAKEAGALGLRAHLPAPFNRWNLLDYVAYAVMIVLAAPFLFFFFFALYALVFGVAWPVIHSILKRNSATANWRVAISGTAEEPHRSMAFDEFVVTMRQLREQHGATRGLTAVGETGGRLFTPISITELVGPNLVVRGIDVSQLAKALQVARDYFSYRFEVRIDEHCGSAYVVAYLRWGGLTEKTWQIPSIMDDDEFDFREIGRQLAYSVAGDGLVRQ